MLLDLDLALCASVNAQWAVARRATRASPASSASLQPAFSGFDKGLTRGQARRGGRCDSARRLWNLIPQRGGYIDESARTCTAVCAAGNVFQLSPARMQLICFASNFHATRGCVLSCSVFLTSQAHYYACVARSGAAHAGDLFHEQQRAAHAEAAAEQRPGWQGRLPQCRSQRFGA